jgi:G3E family GTPase
VIRAKGHFWIATRPDWVAEFSLAGALSSVSPLGRWWASVPQDRWPQDPRMTEQMREHWQDLWGDRRQELVFIGAAMDEAAIRARLDGCLVAGGYAPGDWARLDDPFPVWGARTAA